MKHALVAICMAGLVANVTAYPQTAVTNANNGTTAVIPVFTGSSTIANSFLSSSAALPLVVNGSSLGTTAGNTASLLSLINSTSNVSHLNVFQLRTANGSDWYTATTRIQETTDVTPQGYIDFNPANGPYGLALGSGAGEYVRIANGGNVGIGTTSPAAKLEVAGNVKLTSGSGASITYQDGSVQTVAWNGVLGGGDYAESVDVIGDRAQYEPGDVLVIDPFSKGRFMKSTGAYSTAVMGIYSTRPGVVGRRQLSDRSHMKEEVPMAMVGVVPTKVSAESGAIRPGDLLVTSSKPGYAMKGADRAQLTGAIIGKALEPLDAGLGVIEVAVSIQ